MKKTIHYCWFGGTPLSKIAKKCIKSWQKFFPEYEIKEWNEKNFDINICTFVKQAYENKKWAFVSDYARLYALYNEGGIYFDTDMEVIKKCDFLEDDNLFFGYEENNIIAVGAMGTNIEKNQYIKTILDWYNNQNEFNPDNVFNYAIPKIVTNILKNYEKNSENGIDIIDNKIKIYPEDWFYPINYNYSKKKFTDNTCMVHYYNATWAPKEEKITISILRFFGSGLGNVVLKIYYKLCNIKNYIIGFIKRRIECCRRLYSKNFRYKNRVKEIANHIKNYEPNYLLVYHPEWLGLSNVAKDNFKNIIPIREQYTKKEAFSIADEVNKRNFKIVIFNGFAKGWDMIVNRLKEVNPNVKIKILWHGSNALLTEEYDFQVFMQILKKNKNKIIDEIGFVKKSMYDFYSKKGYNCSFVMNYIDIENKEKYICKKKNNFTPKIGLYCSGDRWVKNTYNQLSAASLIENSTLDCIPLGYKVQELANNLQLNITGVCGNISREDLFYRMAQNDINLYVTFTECAPLLPLESLELGVPCITGDNHHYFEGTELEKYLVVNKEDNMMEIYDKMKYAIKNKDKIIELYNEWKKVYNEEAKKSIEKFRNFCK